MTRAIINTTPAWVSVARAVELFGVSPRTISRLVADGVMRSANFSERLRMVSVHDFEAYCEDLADGRRPRRRKKAGK